MAGLALAGCAGGDTGDLPPQLQEEIGDENAPAARLAFSSTATSNTTRLGGSDVAADAAGVASALFPATSPSSRPNAVVLVNRDDWQGGIAAGVLTGTPIGAPILISDEEDLPAVSEETLARLKPPGSDLARDAQVIRIGERVATPENLRSAVISGNGPFETAAAIDRFSTTAQGEPSEDVLVVSAERPEWAMPAGAWAARSGDSVLYARRDSLPEPTRRAIALHSRPDIFVLGPEPVIGAGVERELRKLGRVRRIEARTPVENAIAFARFESRGFGWGLTVPGNNFTVASTARALDGAASAALGSNGVFAPLLLIDNPAILPLALENYFLDVQPGYEDDPNEGVFNRVWILGDESAVSLQVQGRLDEVAELVPVEVNEP